MRRIWAGLAMAIALGGGTAGIVVITQDDGDAATHQEWVVAADAGNCTRSSTPITYEDAVAAGWTCDSFGAARDVASDGDTIGVKAGTYGVQGAIGHATESHSFMCEDGATIDSGSTNPAYTTLSLNGNVTLDGCDITGEFPIVQITGDGNTWRNSNYTGTGIRTGSPCSDEPILVQSGSDDPGDAITNNLIQFVYVGQFKGVENVPGGCADPNFHLEQIRIGRNVDGLTLDGVFFEDCPNGSGFVGCGSGNMFFTTASGASTEPTNITVRNSRFGVTPNCNIQNADTLPTTALNWTFAYNTFGAGEPWCQTTPLPASGSAIVWTGNLGSRPQNCWTGNTFTKNVWQWASGTACGTDTRVTGDSFSLDQLGVETVTYTLEAGSPAIDAAETTCAVTAGGHDFENDTRPAGSACDAGADERE